MIVSCAHAHGQAEASVFLSKWLSPGAARKLCCKQVYMARWGGRQSDWVMKSWREDVGDRDACNMPVLHGGLAWQLLPAGWV